MALSKQRSHKAEREKVNTMKAVNTARVNTAGTITKKEKPVKGLTMLQKVAWNFPSITNGMLTILLGYLNYYLTQNVYLSAASVGVWLMASKVFDGFTDLIAGYIIERTNTRWGKGRPYSLFASVLWAFVIFIFAVPSYFSTTGKLIYVFVCYTVIQSVCQTFYGCADQVYMIRAVPEEKDRSSIFAIGGVLVTYICAGFSIVMPLIVTRIENIENGWMILSVILGIPCAILASLKFFLIKEQPITDSTGKAVREKKVTFLQMINSLIHNKYAIICFIVCLVYYFGSNLNTAVSTYYFTYNLGNLALASLTGLTSLFTPILLLFIPKLQEKFGKAKVIKAGLVLNVGGCLLRLVGPYNIGILMASTIIAAMGTLPYIYFAALFLMDAMDYGEWRMGYRVESVYSSVSSCAGKIAAGLASGFAGIFMGMTGFISGAETQSASALNGIFFLFIYVPLILGVIMVVIMHFYDLDDKIDDIKKDLLVRRQADQEVAE